MQKERLKIVIILLLFVTFIEAKSVSISKAKIALGEVTKLEAIGYSEDDSFIWKTGIGHHETYANKKVFYFSPKIAGEYIVELFVNGKSESNTTVTVTSSNSIEHIEAGNNQNICLGETATLTAIAPSNSLLEWKIDNNKYADGAVFYFVPKKVGVYTVTLTGNNEEDNLTVTVNDCNNLCDTTTAITREELIQKIGNGEDVTNVNTCAITDMSHLFDPNIYSKEQAQTVANFNQNISGWDTSKVKDMSSMFAFTKAFNQPLNNWDTSKVENMYHMFICAKAFNQPLNNWDTSKVENMYGMFESTDVFNQSLNNWNTSNVKDMSRMFFVAMAFNQPLNNWDTSNVKYMDNMFHHAIVFNQPLNNWDTSNVKNMEGMFYFAKAFNQPLNNWDTSNVKDMAGMFGATRVFNQPLNNWDTSNVKYMQDMFESAEAFNQPLNDWDTSNVKYMGGMFRSAKAFNQPLNNWDTSNVKYMWGMFNGATAFSNHDLSGWDVNNVTNHTDFSLNWGTGNIEPNWN